MHSLRPASLKCNNEEVLQFSKNYIKWKTSLPYPESHPICVMKDEWGFNRVVALVLVALISIGKVKISGVQNLKLERNTKHRVAAAKMTGLWNYAPGFIKISRNKQWNESCSIFKKENYLFEHLMSQSQEAVGVWNLPGFQIEGNLSVLNM